MQIEIGAGGAGVAGDVGDAGGNRRMRRQIAATDDAGGRLTLR